MSLDVETLESFRVLYDRLLEVVGDPLEHAAIIDVIRDIEEDCIEQVDEARQAASERSRVVVQGRDQASHFVSPGWEPPDPDSERIEGPGESETSEHEGPSQS